MESVSLPPGFKTASSFCRSVNTIGATVICSLSDSLEFEVYNKLPVAVEEANIDFTAVFLPGQNTVLVSSYWSPS